jgi:hypothetical protein
MEYERVSFWNLRRRGTLAAADSCLEIMHPLVSDYRLYGSFLALKGCQVKEFAHRLYRYYCWVYNSLDILLPVDGFTFNALLMVIRFSLLRLFFSISGDRPQTVLKRLSLADGAAYIHLLNNRCRQCGITLVVLH